MAALDSGLRDSADKDATLTVEIYAHHRSSISLISKETLLSFCLLRVVNLV
jgi:hypothetical protein